MQGFTSSERKVLSEFFTTIAAAWFAGGVITTIFVREGFFLDTIVNPSLGLIFTFVFLRLAMSLSRK